MTTMLKPESVFCLSIQAQTIAQAIGQAFGVAYQQFLQASGIKASDLRPGEYSDYLESQELYNGDLAHFSDSQNIRDVSRVIVATCLYTNWSCSVVCTSHARYIYIYINYLLNNRTFILIYIMFLWQLSVDNEIIADKWSQS